MTKHGHPYRKLVAPNQKHINSNTLKVTYTRICHVPTSRIQKWGVRSCFSLVGCESWERRESDKRPPTCTYALDNDLWKSSTRKEKRKKTSTKLPPPKRGERSDKPSQEKKKRCCSCPFVCCVGYQNRSDMLFSIFFMITCSCTQQQVFALSFPRLPRHCMVFSSLLLTTWNGMTWLDTTPTRHQNVPSWSLLFLR